MRLRKAQKDILLEWIAEGLETDEINKRAAKFRPRFKVTRQQVDHYRKSRGLVIDEIQDADEISALKKGLAVRDTRVALLQTMADKIILDLFPENDEGNKRWLEMAKTVAEEQYDYVQFNRGQYEELRGILDDIAKEVGGRRPEVEINNYNFNLDAWKKERAARLTDVATLEDTD